MKTRYKLRNTSGEHTATTAHAEDAAALVGILGSGAKVVWENLVTVWTEGAEAFSASESYDAAAEVMHTRINTYWESLGAAKAKRKNQAWPRTSAEFDQVRAKDRADTKAARAAAAAINSRDYKP